MAEREGWRNYAQPVIIPRNVSKGKFLDLFMDYLEF
jgi:hypothetical protein